MKQYKSNYLFTVTFQICNGFLATIPGVIIMGLILGEIDVLLHAIPAYAVVIFVFVILANIIHLIICLFTKHTVFIVDNNKETNYAKSNSILSDLIYSLITDVSSSVDGIYDYSEICSMLEQAGYGVLNTFTRKPTQNNITQDLKRAIETTIFADIETRNSLYYCGIKSSTMRKTVSIDFEELQLRFGYWRDVFIGYQTKSDLIFLSGLQYPSEIITKLYDAIQADKERIKRDMQSVKQTLVFKDDYGIDVSIKHESKRQLSARERLMQMVGK